MAAIAGAMGLAGVSARECAEAVAWRLRHRAPEAAPTYWSRGSIALAHHELAANGVPGGRQPVALADGSVLVVDGRIDDRARLIAALGNAPAGAPDADLFGMAWARWREHLWRYVVGDYAIAVWEPANGVLSLVRDRVGVRPLYWSCNGGWFAFASEAQALLAVPGASGARNNDVIAAILAPPFQLEDPSRTVYEHVRRVLPGCLLQVCVQGEPSMRPYWTFDDLAPAEARGSRDSTEEFRAVFDEAVRCRVQGASNPALMLSGGIDSASIHASALRQGLELERIAVDAEQWNAAGERSNIRAMLAQVERSRHLEVPGAEQHVDADRLVRELFVRSHPVLAALCLPMLVNQAAAQEGSRVVLDGVDGDLALHAPTHYVASLLQRGHLRRAAAEARLAGQHHTYLRHSSPWRIAARAVAAGGQPTWLAKLRDRRASERNGNGAFGTLLHPDLVHALRLRERSLEARLASRDDDGRGDWQRLRSRLWRNHGFMSGMEGFDLAAARWGMESRHPWVDMRLLTLISQMPLSCLVHAGWTKHVARAAYSRELGPVAWHSEKAHLGPQVATALLRAGRSHVDRALRDEEGVLAGLIDPRTLDAVRAQWRQGRDAVADVNVVMTIAVLHRWLLASREQVDASSAMDNPETPPDRGKQVHQHA